MGVYDGSGSPKPGVLHPDEFKAQLRDHMGALPSDLVRSVYGGYVTNMLRTPLLWGQKKRRGPGYRARQKAGRLRREAALKARSRAVKAA